MAKISKPHFYFFQFAEVLAFVVFFFLVNRRIFLLWSMSLEGFAFGKIVPELLLWSCITVFFLIRILKDIGLPAFYHAWRINFPLLLFILIALLSLSWSINFAITSYKVLVLVLTSMIAAYVGLTRTPREFAHMLAWLGGIVAVLCFLLTVRFPEIGTMIGHPYYGAWRGIFWTRARLGSFMALTNLVFLFLAIRSVNRQKLFVFHTSFYFLTLALVILSESATSIILVVILHFLFMIMLAWLKWEKHLKRSHYVVSGLAFLFVALGVAINLDYLFGLLGRSTTLTGRVPLWNYLLSDVVALRPVLGYGFGAIWDTNSFRDQMQTAVGWTFPVIISDNGFLDILLHLGWVGLIPFLVTVCLACIYSFRYFFQNKSMDSIIPLLILVYVIVTNLSLSYFMELEAFVWFLLVSVLFIVSKKVSS
jgi:exopolysaccharide production protein ExoQ